LIVRKAAPIQGGPRFVGRVPGRVVAVSKSEGSVDVLTGDGALRLFEVQPDGAAAEPAANVIKSVKGTLGLRTADLLKRIEQLEFQIRERLNGA
jgi:methionyl-tRNA formyltransferase